MYLAFAAGERYKASFGARTAGANGADLEADYQASDLNLVSCVASAGKIGRSADSTSADPSGRAERRSGGSRRYRQEKNEACVEAMGGSG